MKRVAILLCFLLSACGNDHIAAPSCRVNSDNISAHQGAGACIVEINSKLLVMVNNDKYSIPTSTVDNTKTAQCSAHSATWEATGLNVEVHQIVGSLENGTWLFKCTTQAGFDGSEKPFLAPNGRTNERVQFIDVSTLDLYHWSPSEDFSSVKQALTNSRNNKK